MRRATFLTILPLLLPACATSHITYTEAELESCRKMEQTMGVQTTHDHDAMRGAGMNPMNLSHERCQQILAKAAGN